MKDKKLKGIGGWLLFFLVIFIVSAIGALLRMIAILSPSKSFPQPSSTLKIIEIVVLIIAFIIFLITIITILKKKAIAKKLAIVSIWAYFISSLIQRLIFIKLIPAIQEYYGSVLGVSLESFSTLSKFSNTQIISSIIWGVVWAVIVTLYFIKSKRVKNTLIN